MLLSGCATYCNGKLFLGMGKYKDSEFELTSESPFKEMVDIGMFK